MRRKTWCFVKATTHFFPSTPSGIIPQDMVQRASPPSILELTRFTVITASLMFIVLFVWYSMQWKAVQYAEAHNIHPSLVMCNLNCYDSTPRHFMCIQPLALQPGRYVAPPRSISLPFNALCNAWNSFAPAMTKFACSLDEWLREINYIY